MSFKPFNKTTKKILAKYKSSRNDNRTKCALLKRKCKTLILAFQVFINIPGSCNTHVNVWYVKNLIVQ